MGKIIDTNLLNSPLLSWDGILNHNFNAEKIGTLLRPLLSQNMQSNPWFQTYKTIFEQPHQKSSMCILMPNVIQHIIEKQVTKNITFPNMDIPKPIYNLTLLFDM